MPGLRLAVKAGELTKEITLTHQQAQKLHKRLWAKVRSVSFALERRVKGDMPVDTGRARASWGHWTPGDLRSGEKATPADAYWRADERNLTTEQGSNVDYIEDLNAGHSRQARPGFLDSAELHAGRMLENEVDAVIAEVI